MPGRKDFPQLEPGVTCRFLGAAGECRLLGGGEKSDKIQVPDKTADYQGHNSGIFEYHCTVAFYALRQAEECGDYEVVA